VNELVFFDFFVELLRDSPADLQRSRSLLFVLFL